jgi:hypothetical protein
MSKPNPNLNPFLKDDFFAEVVALDENIKLKSKLAYENFIKIKKERNPEVNHLNNIYLSFVHFITKNAFVATALMLVAVSAFGTSAAQYIAPNSHKPTTLVEKFLKGNVQQPIPTYTSLLADNSNSIYNLSKCGITIKYPNNIAGAEVIPFPSLELNKNSNSTSIIDGITLDDSNFTQSGKDIVVTKPLNQFSIECYPTGSSISNLPSSQSTLKSINKEKLEEDTGWFIAKEANLENIFAQNENGIIWYYFDYEGKTYTFTSRIKNYLPDLRDPIQKDLFDRGYYKKQGIFTQQIQLQFNSLSKGPESTVKTSISSSSSKSLSSSSTSKNSSSVSTSSSSIQSSTKSSQSKQNSSSLTATISSSSTSSSDKFVFMLENSNQCDSSNSSSSSVSIDLCNYKVNSSTGNNN